MPQQLPERLDVEDDVQRQARIQNLLQKTNKSTASNDSPSGPSSSSQLPSTFDFGVRDTHTIQPPTELLERIQAFLPQMEAANADLVRRAQQAPESVDIEHLDPSETGQYIEMNLGLGVFDMHQRRTASEGTALDSSSSSCSTSSSEDDASDSDNDSDRSDSDHTTTTNITGQLLDQLNTPANTSASKRPIKPLPARSRPSIVVLDEQHSAINPSQK